MKTSLVQMRKKSQLTQKEVASTMGVTPLTVRNWEKYTTNMKISQYIRLCNLYHCTVDDIFLPLS